MSFITDSLLIQNKEIDLLNEDTSKTSNQEQDELKEIKRKKITKKKNRNQELLEDTFLFHIGEKKKRNYYPYLNDEVRKMLNKKRTILENDNNKKNNKKDTFHIKKTTIIFHGENYIKTISPVNFMKYNFDFVQREQYKSNKVITNKERQHVNLPLLPSIISKMNKLWDIPKNIWNPSFYKSDIPIKDLLNQIERIWPKHIYNFKEDLALDIIRDKNYKVDNICSFIQSKDFVLFLQKLKKKNIKDEFM